MRYTTVEYINILSMVKSGIRYGMYIISSESERERIERECVREREQLWWLGWGVWGGFG